jgi:hypothetical protein
MAFKVEESIKNFGLKRMRGQLREKKFLSSRFNKKVLGEMSLVIRIEIYRDRRKEVLEVSHRHAKKSF